MSQYQQTTLPSGLKVASESMPGTHTVALAISFEVGSRDESREENGVSHFLEHMAFKGTRTRSARQIAEAFDNVGANLNAFTSTEQTVYYARFLPKDLELTVVTFADILQNSIFDPVELERERSVILQEIAMHQDAPEDLIFQHFHETVYPDQPIGRSILGPASGIETMSVDTMRGYMEKHYHPPRMVITAAGAIDHEKLVTLVSKHFGEVKTRPSIPAVAANYVGGDFREEADFEQLHLVLGFPGLSYNDPDYYAAQMMVTALGGGMSSRLFQEVREKRGLAYSVYGFLSSYRDTGMFGMYAAASEVSGKDLAPVLCEEVMKLAAKGVTEAELQRARSQHVAGLVMMRENVSNVAEWMGRHLLCYGEYRPADKLVEYYEAVTAKDMQRVLKRFLTAGAPTVSALGKQKQVADYAKISDLLKA